MNSKSTQVTTPTFWDAEPEQAPLVDAAGRARISDEGLTFTVTGIRDVTTKHGPTWMLDIELEGERAVLPLSHITSRDAQLARMQPHLADGDGVTCGLARVNGPNGSGWILTRPQDA